MKSKGVTTQMKALDEYFPMVVFTLLLNAIHFFFKVFASFMFNMAVKGLNRIPHKISRIL